MEDVNDLIHTPEGHIKRKDVMDLMGDAIKLINDIYRTDGLHIHSIVLNIETCKDHSTLLIGSNKEIIDAARYIIKSALETSRSLKSEGNTIQ